MPKFSHVEMYFLSVSKVQTGSSSYESSPLCVIRGSQTFLTLYYRLVKTVMTTAMRRGRRRALPCQGADAAVPSPGWAGTGPDTQA